MCAMVVITAKMTAFVEAKLPDDKIISVPFVLSRTSISSLKNSWGASALMYRQLTPSHAQQIVSGIQWVYILVIPGTVHWTLHFKLPCKG